MQAQGGVGSEANTNATPKSCVNGQSARESVYSCFGESLSGTN
ncbi:MAG: hypothetical protein ACK55Z_38060 [bacterium]